MLCKLVAINGRYTHSSLALFHLRNELETNCASVTTEIIQLTIRDPYYEVLLRLSADAPDAIFFSAAVWNSDRVEELINDLHSLLPSCLLIVGGPQAAVVGAALSEGVCTVVRGAIEAVGADFYTDLQAKHLQNYYGKSFFHLQDKQERFRSPYRESDFNTHLQNRNIYYESSRGCPFSCSYCLSSAENGTVHKSLDLVKKEIDQIMAHAPQVLRFVDRTFNDLPDRALALWKLLLDYEADTLFHFEIAPDRISEEMFTFLATIPPGRFQFEIGIQSTHEPTLSAIKRKIDPVIAGNTVSRLAAPNNIHLHSDLILGLPYETKESYLRSFRDIFAMGSHYIQMGLLKMLPDTAITASAEEFEYRYCRKPPYSVLANKWLNGDTLQSLYWFSECVEKFCNNRYFPSVWNYLRSINEDAGIFFEQLVDVSLAERLFQLAPTQQFLCSILVQVISGREDEELLRELLVYDWYRCGQKNLPSFLVYDVTDKRRLRDSLYEQLPAELIGLYSKKERNRFFKQTIFHSFSAKALKEICGTGEERKCLAFLLQREKSLARLQKTVLLPA
jgi:Protein of unknown function (DUF4080)/Radical SAM superfamily